MKKVYILLCLVILVITGCENQKENTKNEYLTIKTKLAEATKFISSEELPISIITDIKRKNDETINYTITLKEPTENMKSIQALVIHNYSNDNTYPSIGLFDSKEELKKEDSDAVLKLKGTIETTKNITNLNLEFRIWIQYQTDRGEKREIYYKST